MHTSTEPTLVPFITQRKGEEAAPNNLAIHTLAPGRHRLCYQDEAPMDRDLRGVLWARCSFNPTDHRQMPTGDPLWRRVHPYRQRMTMQVLRCQVCAEPARTRLGFIFLAGPDAYRPQEKTILTTQPPVCAGHVRAAARLCPHLEGNPTVFLARSAPLYGVHGTVYGIGDHGVQVVASPDHPLPYGHKNLSTVLASQLVRRLHSFRVLTLDELTHNLAEQAA
ncbi:hypothetical protein ACFVGN_18650 [Streptomyces sp. NPDC057757]|uniref:hypothetical protein n=1 Tax=Streptomyces sp. NPDC057757 TaxID=3346241 RepID=UPI0036A71A98